MKKYFVRVNNNEMDKFETFCKQFAIVNKFLDYGNIGSHKDTVLFSASMSDLDAVTLKIKLHVSLVEK